MVNPTNQHGILLFLLYFLSSKISRFNRVEVLRNDFDWLLCFKDLTLISFKDRLVSIVLQLLHTHVRFNVTLLDLWLSLKPYSSIPFLLFIFLAEATAAEYKNSLVNMNVLHSLLNKRRIVQILDFFFSVSDYLFIINVFQNVFQKTKHG